ncbi:MAG: hypothetical protein ACLT1O_05665 [Bifidobacterium pseudocatenulatum]
MSYTVSASNTHGCVPLDICADSRDPADCAGRLLAAAALAIAWMVGKEPMAGGSGIPQTNGVVICGLKMRWQTVLPVRFVGGLLGALFVCRRP